MVVSSNRRGAAQATRCVTARLLVLGDKQVGKSASIVRYTTGRYIQEYSDSTSDWLYRHPLGYDQKRNQNTLAEILEQKDIEFSNSGNFFASSTQANTNQQNQSLASRVAFDQQMASELQEKQEMLNKLHWANAYIIIYAINDKGTFNKAIKYLNLIANNINSPIDTHRHSCSSSCSNSSYTSSIGSGQSMGNSCSSSSNANSGSSNFFNRLSPAQVNGCSGSGKLSPNQVNGNSNSSCGGSSNFNSTTRRPILLLGNKKDLERSSRQVSASDGRLLAMRHQSMFAELSIAESSKLIESYLGNLIEQIDQSSLHVDTLLHNQREQNSTDQQLVQWKPTVEAALSQLSIQLTAPIWGSLVKSKPLVASTMVAQSSKVVKAKLETSDIYSPRPMVLMANSVEVGSAKKALQCTNPAPLVAGNSKYKNLKSSFKRASMAIVSSKGLARNASNRNSASSNSSCGNTQKRSSTTSSEQDSISELSTTSGKSFRISNNNNMDNKHNQSVISLNSQTIGNNQPTKTNNIQISDRFRRPLFRYKNRRTTVAFEDINVNSVKPTTSSQMDLMNQSKLSLNKTNVTASEQIDTISQQENEYDSARNNSARSSSSLSISDTNCSSSLILCNQLERPTAQLASARSPSPKVSNCSSQNTTGLKLNRHSSNTTLSHTSTSGGSYEDSGDESILNSIGTRANHVPTKTNIKSNKSDSSGLTELLASHHHQVSQSPTTIRKRYDLVKSVQSTLSNLTRSSNIASSQTPKRSFCSTLFRQTNPNTTILVKKITEPPVTVGKAQIERIGGGGQMPVMVGFCK